VYVNTSEPVPKEATVIIADHLASSSFVDTTNTSTLATYVIHTGDVPDLAHVPFNATVFDYAGNMAVLSTLDGVVTFGICIFSFGCYAVSFFFCEFTFSFPVAVSSIPTMNTSISSNNTLSTTWAKVTAVVQLFHFSFVLCKLFCCRCRSATG
jgi:hypothetical protein